MSTLAERQAVFLRDISRLILHFYQELAPDGLAILTCTEGCMMPWRKDPAGETFRDNVHRLDSNHYEGLAVDLNLHVRKTQGSRLVYVVSDHPLFRALGAAWKRLGDDHIWGGRINDFNHFALRANLPVELGR